MRQARDGGNIMYWWNVSKLAEDLTNDRVTERERFKYYLADAIVMNAVVQLVIYVGQPFTMWYALSSLAAVVISIVGIVLCYRVNKAGDDADFIERIVCLGWPVTIKLAVLFGVIMIVIAIVGEIMTQHYYMSSTGPEALNELLSLVYEIVLYLMLYKYIKMVSHAKKAQDVQILA
jgi:hypothetical protein